MPVQMVEEGKTFPSDTATDEEKALVLSGADGLMQDMKDQDLNFFLGVFKKGTDGAPGVVLTGRGSPDEMRMLAESLVDKARRTANRSPDGFLDMLKDIFGTDSVVVVEDGSELEGLSLDAAMKGIIERELAALPRGEEEVDQKPEGEDPVWPPEADEVAALHEEMPKKRHPDEA